jgi:hypothetical protein
MTLYSGVREKQIQGQVASVAVTIEALETLLVEKGILKPDELMNRVTKLARGKILGAEQLQDDYAEVDD